MSFIYSIVLFIISRKILIIATGIEYFNSIGRQIIEDVEPHQVTFFIDKHEQLNSFGEDFVIKEMSQGVPFVVEHFEQSFILNKKRLLHLSMSNNARYLQSSVNVILRFESYRGFEKGELENSKIFIHNIVELWSARVTRPKCLLMIINRNLTTKNDSSLLLQYSWEQKLLDFSIIEIQLNNASIPHYCIIQSYNPFYNVTITKKCGQGLPFKIFPDKLRNINGYELKVGVVSSDLFIKSIRNQEGNIIDIRSEDYNGIPFVFKQMNFSIFFNEVGTNDSEKFMNASLLKYEKLQNGEINLEAIPTVMAVPTSFQILQLDYGKSCEETIAVVPIISRYNRLTIPWEFLTIIFIILLIYKIALIISINQSKIVTILDLLRILFGIPISTFPRGFIGIIFVIGFFVSFIWSASFYSTLLKIELEERKIDFDTFKSIDESGLKIFAHKFTFAVAFGSFNITDRHLKNIKEKVIWTDLHGLVSCLERLVEHKDCICLMVVKLAKFLTENLTNESSPRFKLAKPIFACEMWSIKFEKASVYMEKFRQYLEKFHESGVNRALESYQKYEIRFPNNNENKDDHIIVTQLFLILVGGYVTAFVAFLIEHIINYFDYCLRKSRVKRLCCIVLR